MQPYTVSAPGLPYAGNSFPRSQPKPAGFAGESIRFSGNHPLANLDQACLNQFNGLLADLQAGKIDMTSSPDPMESSREEYRAEFHYKNQQWFLHREIKTGLLGNMSTRLSFSRFKPGEQPLQAEPLETYALVQNRSLLGRPSYSSVYLNRQTGQAIGSADSRVTREASALFQTLVDRYLNQGGNDYAALPTN